MLFRSRGYLSGECPEKAYGTTLICVCRTAEYWFGLQIGDGRCVCISDDDRVSEPIPWDDECEGKITTSLCDSDALEKFRYYLGKEIPAAVFMGTDGIDDSYSNSDELYVLYRAVLAIFAEYGEERGKAELEEFLPSFSKKGSGDDVSVAGIISGAVSPEFISMQKAYCEYSNAKAQRTETERAARRAADTLTYVLETMQKAKASYEQCLATVNKVRAEIEQIDREKQSVAERLEVAEKAFLQAREIYNNSVFAPIGEQAPAPGRAEDTCGGAEETEDD